MPYNIIILIKTSPYGLKGCACTAEREPRVPLELDYRAQEHRISSGT